MFFGCAPSGRIAAAEGLLDPLPLSIKPSAIIAKPITGSSKAPLMLRYGTAKWARSVVVIDAKRAWLFDFIDGVEGGFARHLTNLLSCNLSGKGRDRPSDQPRNFT